MGTGSALRELATFVEACESGDGAVTAVCFAECIDPAEQALTADVELTLSADATDGAGVSLRSRIDAEGRLTFALESGDAVIPTEGHDVTVEPADVTVDGGGTVAVTLSATVPTDGDAGATASRETAEAAARSASRAAIASSPASPASSR